MCIRDRGRPAALESRAVGMMGACRTDGRTEVIIRDAAADCVKRGSGDDDDGGGGGGGGSGADVIWSAVMRFRTLAAATSQRRHDIPRASRGADPRLDSSSHHSLSVSVADEPSRGLSTPLTTRRRIRHQKNAVSTNVDVNCI